MVNFLERLEMSILRNRTQESFTIVNQTITKDKELGITERGLLITILSLPDNWEFTIAGLQQILPDGKEKIKKVLTLYVLLYTIIQAKGKKVVLIRPFCFFC